MTTAKDRLDKLEAFLRQLGYNPNAITDVSDLTQRKDYIPHGSEQHAAFLGIIELAGEEEVQPGDVWIASNKSGKVYRLIDPITPFMHFANPQQAAVMTLRGKVNVLESGGPIVHDDAPSLWVPVDVPM